MLKPDIMEEVGLRYKFTGAQRNQSNKGEVYIWMIYSIYCCTNGI